mmetsp:Transcript_17745/g.37513  ORF Transcript_17745/g.37513 Transcript_17745/m.37513 type:complete len:213 (+) Transcript_17745:496-1134(+)
MAMSGLKAAHKNKSVCVCVCHAHSAAVAHRYFDARRTATPNLAIQVATHRKWLKSTQSFSVRDRYQQIIGCFSTPFAASTTLQIWRSFSTESNGCPSNRLARKATSKTGDLCILHQASAYIGSEHILLVQVGDAVEISQTYVAPAAAVCVTIAVCHRTQHLRRGKGVRGQRKLGQWNDLRMVLNAQPFVRAGGLLACSSSQAHRTARGVQQS